MNYENLILIEGMKPPVRGLEDILINDLFFSLIKFATRRRLAVRHSAQIFEIGDGWMAALVPPNLGKARWAIEDRHLQYVAIPSGGFALWHNGRASMVGTMEGNTELRTYQANDHKRIMFLLDALNDEDDVRTQASS